MVLANWNGHKWTGTTGPTVAAPSALSSVTCASTSNCWAVGTAGKLKSLILHWNGLEWTLVNSAVEDYVLLSVACSAVSSCWLVGSPPVIERWNGATRVIAPPSRLPASSQLLSVACGKATSCWAVGVTGQNHDDTLAEHWNGSSWKLVPTPGPVGQGGYCPLSTASAHRLVGLSAITEPSSVGTVGNGLRCHPEVCVMRKLRHPIAVFVMTVLAVVGIGVGLVGGLTYPQVPSHTYGHTPFSFSAAFPTAVFGGKVTVQCLGGGARCGKVCVCRLVYASGEQRLLRLGLLDKRGYADRNQHRKTGPSTGLSHSCHQPPGKYLPRRRANLWSCRLSVCAWRLLRCGRGEEGRCHLGCWGCVEDLARTSRSLRSVLQGGDVTKLRHPIAVFIVMVVLISSASAWA